MKSMLTIALTVRHFDPLPDRQDAANQLARHLKAHFNYTIHVAGNPIIIHPVDASVILTPITEDH